MANTKRTLRLKQIRLLLCMGVALSAAHCASCTPPPAEDPDGHWRAARHLPFDTWRRDQLFCSQGDCADWYLLSVPQPGDLRVEAVSSQPNPSGYGLFLTLTGSRGEPIEETASRGPGTLSLARPVEQGTYLVSLVSPDRTATLLPYNVIAYFEPWIDEPAPPPPQFMDLPSDVLEVVRVPGRPDVVLLARGSGDGLLVGQRGHLLNAGAEIAEIEITEVYESGSRGQLLSPTREPITPDTTAVISVPVSKPQPGGDPPHDADRQLEPGSAQPDDRSQVEPPMEPPAYPAPESAYPPPESAYPPPESAYPPPAPAYPRPVPGYPPPAPAYPRPAPGYPPPVSGYPPPVSANPPPVSVNPPSLSVNPPSLTLELPTVPGYPPPVPVYLPPVSASPPPVPGYPPPVPGYPLPVPGYPPPAPVYPPPAPGYPPPEP